MFISILVILEILTRAAIYFYRGNSTAGMEGRSANLFYQPFLMFGENHDLNLENYKKDSDGINILILGGSTAEFFPEELVNKIFSNYFNRDINIYNSAYRGYNARQELIFLSLWGSKIKPDLIISLDGANDIVHSLRINRSGSFFTNKTYEVILTKPYLGPLIYLLQNS